MLRSSAVPGRKGLRARRDEPRRRAFSPQGRQAAMIEYSMETEIRIDWSDLDPLGHVNNLAIMRYMQTARVLYFDRLGVSPSGRATGVGPIMASVSGQFKEQLRYPGTVKVLTSIFEMKTTSLHMRHHVVDESGGIAAEGHDVIVVFDFDRGVKHAIPDGLRRGIEELEGKKKVFAPGAPLRADGKSGSAGSD